jgi:hypothetical protein
MLAIEGERSMMKVVNAYKRKAEREREKEQKGICIYLCCLFAC